MHVTVMQDDLSWANEPDLIAAERVADLSPAESRAITDLTYRYRAVKVYAPDGRCVWMWDRAIDGPRAPGGALAATGSTNGREEDAARE